jgi:hypothetical protein
MKHFTFSFTLALLFFSTLFVQAVNLHDVLKNKLVREESFWKTKAPEETTSLRHGSNMCLKITSLSNKLLTVQVPAGTLFTASNSAHQDMLLTQEMEINLLPYQSVTRYCSVYCCESSDGAPQDLERYSIQKVAPEKLIKLADFVDEKKYEGYAVQRAIWCISNAHNLSDISSADSSQTKELIFFMHIRNCT